ISSALLERGGVALFIDYGYVEQTGGDTFQAVRNHEYCDPLEAPGSTDLTAHVDFEAIKQAAEKKGVRVSGPVNQGTFLRRIGIEKRAERLMNVATPQQKRDIETGVKRLIDDNEMGRLFKVMALSYPETFQLEGFNNAGCE
ncbi:SAM-dependent methyltransferase, partial [Rhodospirillales bacterium]|nr:SAM-dependent methyltransferase [Rhodospirillales bacterium]